MKRLKIVISFALLFCLSAISKADNNPSNNNSATQLKTGNRNASTDIDAVFYNPAGTVFGDDGFAVEFSLLPFYSSQTIYDSYLDKEYTSTSSSLFYPALNLVYKKDQLAFFSNIGITNGGGAGNYEDGLPGFEKLGMLSMFGAIMGGMPLPSENITDYEYKSNFSGSAYGIGGSIGAAYRFNSWLSASAAVQYSNQNNHQEGYLEITYPPAEVEISRTEIDVDYTGSNFGFIFGLDLKPSEKMLVAQTFRYYTEMELNTTVNDNKDGDGMFVDGSKSKNTYVPFYSLGIAYSISENLLAHLNFNTSLYSMLDLSMPEDTDVNPAEYYNNGWDMGLAIEYQMSEIVNYGIGFTYAPAKMKEEHMSEMEFENNTLWLNTGATIHASEKLDLNLAFQAGIATEERTVEVDGMSQTYTKNPSYSLGLGASYRF